MFRLISVALLLCVSALLYFVFAGFVPQAQQQIDPPLVEVESTASGAPEPVEYSSDIKDLVVESELPTSSGAEVVSASMPQQSSAEEKEQLAQHRYIRLRNRTLRAFKSDYANSVYSSIRVPGWFDTHFPAPDIATGSSVQPAVRSYVPIRQGVESTVPDNSVPFVSRGLPATIGATNTTSESGFPLSYAGASAASLSRETRRTKRSEPSCGKVAQRAWHGAARISSRDYIESFVVCEAESLFSIVVDWRTSDVCQLDDPIRLPNQIRSVEVVQSNRVRSEIHRRIGSKDRLAIQLISGERMLLTCENAHWAVLEAGALPWSAG